MRITAGVDVGSTQTKAVIMSDNGGRKILARALVDTGASLTVIPQELARRLALVPFKIVSVETAGGVTKRMPVAQAMVRIDGRAVPASVV